MALTARQQGQYRPLVAKAWAAHCRTQLDGQTLLKDKGARDTWYRSQVRAVLGVDTTTNASAKSHFLPLMAHFEPLVGDSIYWVTQLASAELRDWQWQLKKTVREHGVEDDYVRGIALQMFDTRKVETLNGRQIKAITLALRKHLGRRKATSDPF